MGNPEVRYKPGAELTKLRLTAVSVFMAWSLAVLLVGCATGPDFKLPAEP